MKPKADLNREKEEFEKYMAETYELTEDYLEKDDLGAYMRTNVRFMFLGWKLAKKHTKENQAG